MSLFPAGHILTSADMDTLFPVGVGAWTPYTPTLTQSGVVTKTVNVARYMKTGRGVEVEIMLTVTGAGTGANAVQVGLPLTAANIACKGSGYILDTSAGLFYAGAVYPSSTTVVGLLIGNAAGVVNIAGITGFTAALAVGDVISMNLLFEATS